MDAIQIQTYSVRANGKRGASIALPPVWLRDLGMKTRDDIDVFRDDQGRLILVPVSVSENGEKNERFAGF